MSGENKSSPLSDSGNGNERGHLSRCREIAKCLLPKPIYWLFAYLCRVLLSTLNRSKPRPYPNDYAYQSEFLKLVPKHGIILDLASGHNPFPKATILSDRYLGITSHRRQELTLDNRPFVLLDIHELPFKTKSIDYIYCSHVIEHVDSPEHACAEIMRVGKAGYVEAPSLMKDVLFGWAKEMSHKWHVVRFDNRLVFFEYDEHLQMGIPSDRWRREILSEKYYPNQDLFYPHQDFFNTFLEWKDSFELTVYRHSTKTARDQA